jgi:hypothetical protein
MVGINDPVLALDFDQAAFVRLSNANVKAPITPAPAGLRHETPADFDIYAKGVN